MNRRAKIIIGVLVLANFYQLGDRIWLTDKLDHAYKAQRAFEQATDHVIALYSERIAQLYAGKCGTE